MHLVVTKDGQTINEFQFGSGPIQIGRHADSQVFLSDRAVSRHHAVIYSTPEGIWYAEDLDSANETYLNDEILVKSRIKTGDILRIADFDIKINLEDGTIVAKPINLEDTLTKSVFGLGDGSDTQSGIEPQIIVRRLDVIHAPDIKMPYKRVKDFVQMTEMICRSNGLEDVLSALVKIGLQQFNGFHVWATLRGQSGSAMTIEAGKNRDGSLVKLSEIKLKDKIDEAVEKGHFFLFPRIPYDREKTRINSVLIAPIIGLGGCFGVLYIDNAMDHEHYSLSALDYLMLVAIHTSVIIENF